MNGIIARSAGALICVLALLGGCVINPISSSGAPKTREPLFEFPAFQDQPTGIAVSSQGRIFVNFPRWDKDPLYSVAELLPDGTLKPYPDHDWNRWGKVEADHPEAHFICVQSVVADGDDLWVLDPASPAFKGVVPGGAKLVKFNLATHAMERNIPFDDAVAPKDSYLNDVRLDPDGKYAYITDSGTGAIVVVDLKSGKSWRRLSGHPSTRAEPGYVPVIGGKELRDESGQVPQIHADGIAIDAEGEYLYYHALIAKTLYRIRTSALTDPGITEELVAGHVEKVAETGAVDGMLMDSDNNLYLTALERNAILRYRPAGDAMTTIAQDDRIQWPDSMDISADGFLYFTASQIHRMPRFNSGKDGRILPYSYFKVWLTP